MSGFWRKPPTLMDVVWAVPVYIIMWLVMNLIVRPIVGNQVMDEKLGGAKGEYFGPDGPKKILLGFLYAVLILGGFLFLLWLLGRCL